MVGQQCMLLATEVVEDRGQAASKTATQTFLPLLLSLLFALFCLSLYPLFFSRDIRLKHGTWVPGEAFTVRGTVRHMSGCLAVSVFMDLHNLTGEEIALMTLPENEIVS